MRKNAKDLESRCESKCSYPTPWSISAHSLSIVARSLKTKTRCTLEKGHSGKHLGPDETEWN